MNTKQIRNRATGEVRDHAEGIIPDGWGPFIPFLMMDNARAGGPGPATLGAAARILGDTFQEAAFAGMSDQQARHHVVQDRLGAVAAGRPVSFLDAAWSTLAGTGSSPSAAANPMPRMTDAGLQAGRDAAHGAHDARTHALAQSWKSPEQVAHEATYEEALRAGGGDGKAAYRARCAMLTTAWQRGAA